MKDNIPKGVALNRKIVIEIRFDPDPIVLDTKGTILNELKKLNLFQVFNWEIGNTNVSIKDNNDLSMVRNQILIEINRIAYICSKIDSIESFYNKFQKIYNSIGKTIDLKQYTRIGCRIQGTYKTSSTDFKSIYDNFKTSFPNQIFLEDFPGNDLLFRLNYNNGMYQIGPVKENDEFLKREFPYQERNNLVGIAIDTDNYLLNTSNNIINNTTIKDVLVASLAVEKSLYEKLKEF